MVTLLDKWLFVVPMASDKRLSRTDLGCAIHLLEMYNDEEGCAWPSIETLAERVGAHRTTVIASIHRLERRGYFRILTGGGRKRSNRYQPNFDKVVRRPSYQQQTVAPAKEYGSAGVPKTVAHALPDSSDRNRLANPLSEDDTSSRGTRFPPNRELPPDWADWAADQGHLDPQGEFERFRDYWIAQPGQKGRKANWSATWRNWIRRSLEDGRGRKNHKVSRGAAAAAAILDVDVD